MTFLAVFPSPSASFHCQSGFPEVIDCVARSIFSGSKPDNMLEPASMISGVRVTQLHVKFIVSH